MIKLRMSGLIKCKKINSKIVKSVPIRLSDTISSRLDMDQNWPERHLFVSSTFRDFHAERDHLRQVVFPTVAEWLRARHVHFVPIDLRWGVDTATAGAADDGKELHVLSVCFDEIRRSLPFALVMLGDRYGWTPPAEVVRRVAAPELGDPPAASVTGLEVEFLLRSGGAAPRFYFREPLPYDAPGAMTADAVRQYAEPPGSEAATSLARLKDRIRAAYPDRVRTYRAVWDAEGQRVTGLAEFGRQVQADLILELAAGLADATGPQPWPEEETDRQEEFATGLVRTFRGRAERIDALEQHLVTLAGPAGLVLEGEPGVGKSAVCAAIVRRLRDRNAGGNGPVLVLSHAVGAGPRSVAVADILARWLRQLAPDRIVPDTGLEQAFAAALREAAGGDRDGRRVAIVIDGIEQLEPIAARRGDWLMAGLPPGVRALASVATATLGPTDWPGCPRVVLEPLTADEAADAANARCQAERRALNPAVVAELLVKTRPDGRPAAGNPLWMALAVDRLNQAGLDDFAAVESDRYAGLTADARINARLTDLLRDMPPDLPGLYQWLLHHIEGSAAVTNPQAVQTFALFLALHPPGWRETDLRRLIPAFVVPDTAPRAPDFPEVVQPAHEFHFAMLRDPAQVAPLDPLSFATLRRAFATHLRRLGGDERLGFAHRPLIEAVVRRYANFAPYSPDYDGPAVFEARLAAVGMRHNPAFRADLLERGLKPGQRVESIHLVALAQLAALDPADPIRQEGFVRHVLHVRPEMLITPVVPPAVRVAVTAALTDPAARARVGRALAELILDDEPLPGEVPFGSNRAFALLGNPEAAEAPLATAAAWPRDVVPHLRYNDSPARTAFVRKAFVGPLIDWLTRYLAARADDPTQIHRSAEAAAVLGDFTQAWESFAASRAVFQSAVDRIAAGPPTDAGLHRTLALLHSRVGLTYQYEQNPTAAVPHFRRYAELLRDLPVDPADPAAATDVWIAVGRFAAVCRDAQMMEAARDLAAEAAERLSRTGLGPLPQELVGDMLAALLDLHGVLAALGDAASSGAVLDALDRAVAAAPPSAIRFRVTALEALAMRDYQAGDPAAATRRWEEAEAGCQELLTEDPNDLAALDRTAFLLSALGQVYAEAGRRADAYAVNRRRAAVLTQLLRLAPARTEYARSRAMTAKRLMELCIAQDMYAEANEHLNAYHAYFRATAAARPDDVRSQFDASMADLTVAEVFEAGGQPADAATWFRQGTDAILRLLPDLPDDDAALCDEVANQLLILTQTALRGGRGDEAAEYLEHANIVRGRLGRPPLQIQPG